MERARRQSRLLLLLWQRVTAPIGGYREDALQRSSAIFHRGLKKQQVGIVDDWIQPGGTRKLHQKESTPWSWNEALQRGFTAATTLRSVSFAKLQCHRAQQRAADGVVNEYYLEVFYSILVDMFLGRYTVILIVIMRHDCGCASTRLYPARRLK